MAKTRIPVFFIEPTDRARFWLRRYASNWNGERGGPCKCHNAKTLIGDDDADLMNGETPDHDDPRWPVKCEKCDYVFAEDDSWQLFSDRIYRRHDDHSVEMTLRDAPAGAIWNADWITQDRDLDDPQDRMWIGPDGRSLVCKLPDGHEWMIDGKASNCTMPEDRKHKCWVRHGSPEDGTIHVDKNGLTCKAGAGSIKSPNWHGFLQHGHLVK